jgi:hypothetical protein
MKLRKLISAENYLKEAISTFSKIKVLDKDKRPDIPVIPKCILEQKIMLQCALLNLSYGKKMKCLNNLNLVLRIGKIYDPETRAEALQTMKPLVMDVFWKNPIEVSRQIKNIDEMLNIFDEDRSKN